MARFSSSNSVGIPQYEKNTVDFNSHYANPDWNGKHLYFVGGGWDAIFLPTDGSLNLPIGFTFTIITDDSTYVYLNANDSDYTYLQVVSVPYTPYGYDVVPNTMVTVIKIDADRWMASGYGMTQD